MHDILRTKGIYRVNHYSPTVTRKSSLFQFEPPFPVLHLNLNLSLLDFLAIDLDRTPHHIPRLDLAHALGRTRQHQIPRFQRHHTGDVCELPRDPEQHQIRRVRLPQLIADGQLQERIVRVRDRGLRDPLGDREEGVKALGDRPGKSLLLGLVLQVARGHVDGQHVAVDGVERRLVVVRIQVAECLPDDETQFDFVVEFDPLGSQHGALSRNED